MECSCLGERCGVLWAAGQTGVKEAGSVLLVGCLGTLGLRADEGLGNKGVSPWPQTVLASGAGGQFWVCLAEGAVKFAEVLTSPGLGPSTAWDLVGD